MELLLLLPLFSASPRRPIFALAYAPSIRRQDIAGVWRLTFTERSLPPATSDGSIQPEEKEVELLLKLNEDGTFAQYGAESSLERKEGQMERWLQQEQYRRSDCDGNGITGTALTGRWHIVKKKLLLASDRREDHDTLLSGNIHLNTIKKSVDDNSMEEAGALSIPEGEISVGKFMYPRTHPNFFEQPMYDPSTNGTFVLRQVLSFHDPLGNEDEEKERIVRYQKRDFYGRKFLLTVSPIPTKKRAKSKDADQLIQQQPFDIRILPIEFHSNNTFTALGTNKILRGRYGTTGNEKDQLWFSVSLFGSGRSVKGSVFSEGQGLGQDDKRTYIGEITEMGSDTDADADDTIRLCVNGSVLYGSDFDEGARPHPVATFIMRELGADDGAL